MERNKEAAEANVTVAQTMKLTTSNKEKFDANKSQIRFDAGVSQYIGWYGNPVQEFKSMIDEEEEEGSCNVMPHVVLLAFELLGTGESLQSQKIQERLKMIDGIVKQREHSKQEVNHVNALKEWISGDYVGATVIWERILTDHPEDTLALKFAHDAYFYLGDSNSIYESVNRVIHYYDKLHLKSSAAQNNICAFEEDDVERRKELFSLGYVLGMYAFGLEETGRYVEAEATGRRALQINKRDAWALHAVVHVLEMQGRQEEGIKFIKEREQDWKQAESLACHNYWHLALYHIERGEFSEAISVFDREVGQRLKNSDGAILDLVDGSSLLYRLLMESQVTRNDTRWTVIRQLWKPHIDDHVLVFNDVHIAQTLDVHSIEFKEFIESWRQYVSKELELPGNSNLKVAKEVGNDIVNAIYAFGQEQYKTVVELLLPHYKNQEMGIIRIGGSHAQRDVILQLLLNALVRVKNMQEEARSLLLARKQLKPNSGVTDRLLVLLAC